MPAVKEIKTADYHLLLWEIEEDYQFFAKDINLSFIESQELAMIAKDARKLEWMASRFVQRQLIDDSLIKDDCGKPYLENEAGFISLSHCKGYAAAIYSFEKACGIDVEPIHDKVLRIADKFLTAREKALCSGDNVVENYIGAWCIKETAYKWFGKKNLNFKENLCIQTLSLNTGSANLEFSKNEMNKSLNVCVVKHENIIVSHLAEK